MADRPEVLSYRFDQQDTWHFVSSADVQVRVEDPVGLIVRFEAPTVIDAATVQLQILGMTYTASVETQAPAIGAPCQLFVAS